MWGTMLGRNTRRRHYRSGRMNPERVRLEAYQQLLALPDEPCMEGQRRYHITMPMKMEKQQRLSFLQRGLVRYLQYRELQRGNND